MTRPKWQVHLGVVILFFILTAVLFSHRWLFVDPSSVYSMPDVDTDGTIWFIWLKAHTGHLFSSIGTAKDVSYPFGYDLSPFPFDNLLDDVRAWAVHAAGGGWKSLIWAINISALIAYPLAACTMYALCWKITGKHAASVAGAVIFAFSGYFLMLSRGSMSNNHFWLLPLVYLFLMRGLESGRLWYVVLSCAITAVQFKINAYWAFYGWLFTPFLFAVQPWTLRRKAVLLGAYCVLSGVLLFLVNLEFVRQQWFLVTNPAKSNLVRPAGGIENAIFPEGVPLVPGIGSKIYFFSAPLDVGAFLGYSVLCLIILACLQRRFWRQDYWVAFAGCLLLSIVLSSYFPALLLVNHVYFFFFDMFRGVSRVVQISSFFAGLLVAMIFAKCRWKPGAAAFAVSVFCFFYILEVYPGSESVVRTTDMGQVAKIYEGIGSDSSVTAVASYPMVYANVTWGTASLFEALGQVVHQKPIAGGKDLRMFEKDPEGRPLFGEIDDPRTIDNLAANGINRIVIYNRILENASAINRSLLADQRLDFVGRYQIPERECGAASLLCRSLDINVYAIKNIRSGAL